MANYASVKKKIWIKIYLKKLKLLLSNLLMEALNILFYKVRHL